jgi:hypothetical protein
MPLLKLFAAAAACGVAATATTVDGTGGSGITLDNGKVGGDKFDHCIIGGGPGGLQLAYFLEQSQRSYVLFERGPRAGNFFVNFPRHRNLISINKKSTPRHGQHPDFKVSSSAAMLC